MSKETLYAHLSGNKYFCVDSEERNVIHRVKKLKEQHPDDVEIVADSDGTISAKVPADWIKIRPKRHIEMSEEQRIAAADRMRKAREVQKNG